MIQPTYVSGPDPWAANVSYDPGPLVGLVPALKAAASVIERGTNNVTDIEFHAALDGLHAMLAALGQD